MRTWHRTLIAVLMLFSGAALLASLYLHLSLRYTLSAFFVFATAGWALTWIRLNAAQRLFVKRRLKRGVLAGTAATIAYDVTRYTLAELWGNANFKPFETWRIFGRLIAGPISNEGAFWVGMAYHFLNGITFACAFFLFIGHRALWKGVVWALVLEAMMFTVYPGWLNLEAVMVEFTVVSLTGHVVYGLVIGMNYWTRDALNTKSV